MPEKSQADKVKPKRKRMSPRQQEERKNSVLTKPTPSVVRSISNAIVIKEDALFFLSEPDGNVPMYKGHGYGLYYHDCRYLNGYELTLASTDPSALVATAERGYSAVYQLTNIDMPVQSGKSVPKEQIAINWTRTVDIDTLALQDVITLQNFTLEEYRFPLKLQFRAEFEDVFAVRGLLQEKMGKVEKPHWDDGLLRMMYSGTDGLYRSVSVFFSEQPHERGEDSVVFDIKLGPREKKQLDVSIVLAETANKRDAKPARREIAAEMLHTQLDESAQAWVGGQTKFESDSLLLNNILHRSLLDLRVLRSSMHGLHYYNAGLPWFGTLYGRDSAITCLQTLAFNPSITADTLRLLALLQGEQEDNYKDEQPGKILHSTLVGEMARTGALPYSPYYGAVDATPLFLILMSQYIDWTGYLELFSELQSNVERALEWIDKYGDTDGDGYTDYASTAKTGIVNQGWKDSGDGIVDADGKIAQAPIAMIEVQGYVFMAKQGIARLYRLTGDEARAGKLEAEAGALRERFNRDFWLELEGFYAMALQHGGKPCAVRSSNPGQAMWTGIVADERCHATVDMLVAKDMNNGWGVRTLSSETRSYNPIGYHLGTVWPHDNSIIAAGFRRYGYDKEARQLCSGIIEAAMYFHNYRLPELFAGFSREEYKEPVNYPVACHPQAWAAGSLPFLITTLLGLNPDACANRLRIVRPTLPDMTDRIQLSNLQVGKSRVDLLFKRNGEGRIEAEVLRVDGTLDVQVEGQGDGGEDMGEAVDGPTTKDSGS